MTERQESKVMKALSIIKISEFYLEGIMMATNY